MVMSKEGWVRCQETWTSSANGGEGWWFYQFMCQRIFLIVHRGTSVLLWHAHFRMCAHFSAERVSRCYFQTSPLCAKGSSCEDDPTCSSRQGLGKGAHHGPNPTTNQALSSACPQLAQLGFQLGSVWSWVQYHHLAPHSWWEQGKVT
jgi:hypothetical protein